MGLCGSKQPVGVAETPSAPASATGGASAAKYEVAQSSTAPAAAAPAPTTTTEAAPTKAAAATDSDSKAAPKEKAAAVPVDAPAGGTPQAQPAKGRGSEEATAYRETRIFGGKYMVLSVGIEAHATTPTRVSVEALDPLARVTLSASLTLAEAQDLARGAGRAAVLEAGNQLQFLAFLCDCASVGSDGGLLMRAPEASAADSGAAGGVKAATSDGATAGGSGSGSGSGSGDIGRPQVFQTTRTVGGKQAVIALSKDGRGGLTVQAFYSADGGEPLTHALSAADVKAIVDAAGDGGSRMLKPEMEVALMDHVAARVSVAADGRALTVDGAADGASSDANTVHYKYPMKLDGTDHVLSVDVVHSEAAFSAYAVDTGEQHTVGVELAPLREAFAKGTQVERALAGAATGLLLAHLVSTLELVPGAGDEGDARGVGLELAGVTGMGLVGVKGFRKTMRLGEPPHYIVVAGEPTDDDGVHMGGYDPRSGIEYDLDVSKDQVEAIAKASADGEILLHPAKLHDLLEQVAAKLDMVPGDAADKGDGAGAAAWKLVLKP